jgi:hypothetical protein
VGLEVDQDDVEDLVKPHNREITTEDLQELDSFIEHDSGEQEQEKHNAFTTAQLNECLNSWDSQEIRQQTSIHRVFISSSLNTHGTANTNLQLTSVQCLEVQDESLCWLGFGFSLQLD